MKLSGLRVIDLSVFLPGPYLTLAGHTHGGQIDFPLLGPIAATARWPKEWVYGHYAEGGRHLVVSAGLGESVLPMRFRCPPEIVEVTIESPAMDSPRAV